MTIRSTAHPIILVAAIAAAATLAALLPAQPAGATVTDSLPAAESKPDATPLRELCPGIEPRELTQLHGVALTTVRTQIAAIRLKVGAQSIGDVLRRVAVLPPVVGALRGVA